MTELMRTTMAYREEEIKKEKRRMKSMRTVRKRETGLIPCCRQKSWTQALH
jgi:hypothetical protein